MSDLSNYAAGLSDKLFRLSLGLPPDSTSFQASEPQYTLTADKLLAIYRKAMEPVFADRYALVSIDDLLHLLREMRKDSYTLKRQQKLSIWHAQKGRVILEIYVDKSGRVERGMVYLIPRPKMEAKLSFDEPPDTALFMQPYGWEFEYARFAVPSTQPSPVDYSFGGVTVPVTARPRNIANRFTRKIWHNIMRRYLRALAKGRAFIHTQRKHND